MKKNDMYKDLAIFDIKKTDPCVFQSQNEDKCGRNEHFQSEREIYGFDSRETWELHYTTILWLYAHLKRYRKWGKIIDMDGKEAHHYTVKIIKKDKHRNYICYEKGRYHKIQFQTKKRNLPYGKIIDLICEYFTQAILHWEEEESLANAFAKKGMKLYAEILPSLWW